MLAKKFICVYNIVYSSGLWLQVDASCRPNDPRKQLKLAVSTVQLRSKSCRNKIYARGVVVGSECVGANPPAGECGGENQVS